MKIRRQYWVELYEILINHRFAVLGFQNVRSNYSDQRRTLPRTLPRSCRDSVLETPRWNGILPRKKLSWKAGKEKNLRVLRMYWASISSFEVMHCRLEIHINNMKLKMDQPQNNILMAQENRFARAPTSSRLCMWILIALSPSSFCVVIGHSSKWLGVNQSARLDQAPIADNNLKIETRASQNNSSFFVHLQYFNCKKPQKQLHE